jgi:hypothetical protein
MLTGNHNKEASPSQPKSVEEEARENNTARWDFYKEPVRVENMMDTIDCTDENDEDGNDEEMGNEERGDEEMGDEGGNVGVETTDGGKRT